MTYIVIDTETTGMDPEKDRIIEIAAVDKNRVFAHSLVNPEGVPISYGAMATHHITDAMVAEAPVLADALWNCGLDEVGPVATPVMHNAAFDLAFLPERFRAQPHICTYRCALHLFPDAESHSNGALWYELGLNHPMPPEAGSMPHRALFDALMTSDLLAHMLTIKPLEQLIRLTTAPVVLTTCRFGKHRGEAWADIPTDYMRWVLKQDFDEDVKHTCRHWIGQRQPHGAADPGLSRRLAG